MTYVPDIEKLDESLYQLENLQYLIISALDAIYCKVDEQEAIKQCECLLRLHQEKYRAITKQIRLQISPAPKDKNVILFPQSAFSES